MLDPKAIGACVKDLRHSAGLSQARLAERAGITDETVSRLERGAFEPSLSTLVAVAEVLEVDLDALVGRSASALARAPRAGRKLPAAHSQLLARFERLDPKAQRAVLQLAELLPQKPSRPRRRSARTAP